MSRGAQHKNKQKKTENSRSVQDTNEAIDL